MVFNLGSGASLQQHRIRNTDIKLKLHGWQVNAWISWFRVSGPVGTTSRMDCHRALGRIRGTLQAFSFLVCAVCLQFGCDIFHKEHWHSSNRPVLQFPVHKIRHLFTVKAYVVPVAGIAFFVSFYHCLAGFCQLISGTILQIWSIVKARGIGPIVHQRNTIHGSQLGWAMVNGIMTSIANFATLIMWALLSLVPLGHVGWRNLSRSKHPAMTLILRALPKHPKTHSGLNWSLSLAVSPSHPSSA